MSGIIGEFEGVPVMPCKCGHEPTISNTYDEFTIFCNHCNKYGVKFEVNPGYEIDFNIQKSMIENWNSVVEVYE